MTTENFKQAFTNNFYLSREYAAFCSKVTGIGLNTKEISGKKIYLLKNKNISISNYSHNFCQKMKKEGISFMAVLPEINNQTNKPSFIEYAIFHKQIYKNAFKKYKRSFKDGLKQGKRYNHEVKIIRKPNQKLIAEVYESYTDQMKRLNSAIFPKSFFVHFMNSPSSLLFLIKLKKEFMAYSFCFENKDNIYTSIGGGNQKFFKYKCMNKLYDELIKYACDKKINIHFGIGQRKSGYNRFKENGISSQRCYLHASITS